MPQHGAHADRIAVVVRDAEVEHGATGGRGFDRMAERRHLMTYGFDHDVRPVGGIEVADPTVTSSPHKDVGAELLGDLGSVDRVDAGDPPSAPRFGHTGEQQPD